MKERCELGVRFLGALQRVGHFRENTRGVHVRNVRRDSEKGAEEPKDWLVGTRQERGEGMAVRGASEM